MTKIALIEFDQTRVASYDYQDCFHIPKATMSRQPCTFNFENYSLLIYFDY